MRLSKTKLLERARLTLNLSRPPFLVFTFWVIAAGMLTTGNIVLPTEKIPIVILVSLLGQTAVFSVNDYFDRETDGENDRKGGIAGAVVTSENENFVKKVALASHGGGGRTAFFLPLFSVVSMLVVLAISLGYSAPPLRLKNRPIFDSASNAVLLYFTFAIGTGLAGGGLQDVVSGALWFSILFGGVGHMVASYIDRESDREAGLKTSGNVLRRRGIVLAGQIVLVTMLLVEKWSPETRYYLFFCLASTVYPLITGKHLKKAVYLWAGISIVYFGIWTWIRAVGL